MNHNLFSLCAACIAAASITACNGNNRRSAESTDTFSDSLPLSVNTVVARKAYVLTDIEIDTRAFPQFEFRIGTKCYPFTYTDTVLNGHHIICGTAVTHEPEERVELSYVSEKNITEPGTLIYAMIDPIDGKDIMFFRRKMFIDSLNIRNVPYMWERVRELCIGDCTFKDVRGDTIVLNCIFGINNTDAVYDLDLKFLVNNDSISLNIVDNPIIYGDDDYMDNSCIDSDTVSAVKMFYDADTLHTENYIEPN